MDNVTTVKSTTPSEQADNITSRQCSSIFHFMDGGWKISDAEPTVKIPLSRPTNEFSHLELTYHLGCARQAIQLAWYHRNSLLTDLTPVIDGEGVITKATVMEYAKQISEGCTSLHVELPRSGSGKPALFPYPKAGNETEIALFADMFQSDLMKLFKEFSRHESEYRCGRRNSI